MMESAKSGAEAGVLQEGGKTRFSLVTENSPHKAAAISGPEWQRGAKGDQYGGVSEEELGYFRSRDNGTAFSTSPGAVQVDGVGLDSGNLKEKMQRPM